MKTQKRKMVLVLPILVIPFLTLGFWALGGGSGKGEKDETATGLNLTVPDANLKGDKLMDKLGFYEKAEKDSLKMEEWMRNDPYFNRKTSPQELFPDALPELSNNRSLSLNQRLDPSLYKNSTTNPEEQILEKLNQLDAAINSSVQKEPVGEEAGPADFDFKSQLDRLQHLLKVQGSDQGTDPDMDQLDVTLDKILDIQHPERVKERRSQQPVLDKGSIYSVQRSSGADTIVKGFFGLSSEQEISEHNSIEAVVHENQVVVKGAIVKLRLVNAIYLGGKLVPAGSFVFGVAQLEGERLLVEINSIRSVKNLFDVKLQVYDMDGMPGIYIPGTISRDVAKQSADNSLSLMDIGSLDPSLKAQATAAGIGVAKNLLSRKVKLVQVLVKAGYKVLLKDKNI